jgi:hypothetical protein
MPYQNVTVSLPNQFKKTKVFASECDQQKKLGIVNKHYGWGLWVFLDRNQKVASNVKNSCDFPLLITISFL